MHVDGLMFALILTKVNIWDTSIILCKFSYLSMSWKTKMMSFPIQLLGHLPTLSKRRIELNSNLAHLLFIICVLF